MRISCKHCEVINDGLEVGDFSQHSNFTILQNKSERGEHLYITLLFVVYFTIPNRGGCYHKKMIK